jgi:hypothetical protein
MNTGPVLQRFLGWVWFAVFVALTVGLAAVLVIATLEGVPMG